MLFSYKPMDGLITRSKLLIFEQLFHMFLNFIYIVVTTLHPSGSDMQIAISLVIHCHHVTMYAWLFVELSAFPCWYL
jgi:hypothetical protein